MWNPALSRSGKSLVLACVQGNLCFPAVAKHLRRLFGPCGVAVRQDVLVAANADVSSGEVTDFEVRVANPKAEKEGEK